MKQTKPRLTHPAYRKFARRRSVSWFWRLFRWGALVAVLVVIGSCIFAWRVDAETAPLIHTYDAPDLPHRHVAMVFGAGLNRNG